MFAFLILLVGDIPDEFQSLQSDLFDSLDGI